MIEPSASNVSTTPPIPAARQSPRKRFYVDLARAAGGAILFSFPMLMTMEMWWAGFSIDNLRLALFLFLSVPMLIGLSYYGGFEGDPFGTFSVMSAFAAYAVGFVTSAAMLTLFAIVRPGMSADEIVGKIAVQAVLASIGAMLARNQLGGAMQQGEDRKRRSGYAGELIFMAVGALFLSASLAATEEMVLIAFKMTEWHAVTLAVVTLLVMHAFVYAVAFRGQVAVSPETPFWSDFVRFTVTGYAIALCVSAYALWIFGRMEGTGVEPIIRAVLVLGFPAALGAATSRLIL